MPLSPRQIEDFNYIYFNPNIDSSIYPKRSIAKNILFFLVKIARDFLYDLSRLRFTVSFDQSTVFYVTSANDYASLKSVHDLTNVKKIMINNPPRDQAEGVMLPRFIPSVISLFFLPAFLRYYFQSGSKKKQMINYSRNDALLTYGYFYYFDRLFKTNRPLGLVLANDHTFHARIFVHFCNLYDIPSFYVQHASVTEHFPKLNMRYALLEGEDARSKYIKAGSDPAKIHLIGMIKYDPFVRDINTTTAVRTIGYAISLENTKKLIEDVNVLISKFPDYRIIIRPHPWYYTYMQREQLALITGNLKPGKNLLFSDPRQESAFAFLRGIDLLIAGDSSIHLEGVLLNVLSVYYDNRGMFDDYYGYVHHGLSIGARNIDEVIKIIDLYKDQRPKVRDKAKRYVATLETPLEGKSSQLAADFIETKINGARP